MKILLEPNEKETFFKWLWEKYNKTKREKLKSIKRISEKATGWKHVSLGRRKKTLPRCFLILPANFFFVNNPSIRRWFFLKERLLKNWNRFSLILICEILGMSVFVKSSEMRYRRLKPYKRFFFRGDVSFADVGFRHKMSMIFLWTRWWFLRFELKVRQKIVKFFIFDSPLCRQIFSFSFEKTSLRYSRPMTHLHFVWYGRMRFIFINVMFLVYIY